MRGSKEIYEDMIGRHNSLENHFKMLEAEYEMKQMKCSRCGESDFIDFIHYSGFPDHALCEHCNDDMNG